MHKGYEFFIGILLATAIAAICIQGAIKFRDVQSNTATQAEVKASQLLQ